MLCRECEMFDKCVLQPMDCAIFMGDKKQKPQEQTNEEWFCGLPTEEKAGFMAQIVRDGCDAHKRCVDNFEPLNIFKTEFWKSWLKERHYANTAD